MCRNSGEVKASLVVETWVRNLFIARLYRISQSCSLALLVLALTACAPEPEPAPPEPPAIVSLRGQIFGTSWLVSLRVPENSIVSSTSVQSAVEIELARIDGVMSTWKVDSELSLLNASESGVWYALSEELMQLLSLARELHQQSDGAFDITIGPLVNLWGFGPDGKPESTPPRMFIDAARERVGIDKFELDPANGRIRKSADIYLDLSAVAKGYAVDAVGDLLRARGVANYLVEIGGEIRVGGEKQEGEPWQIGVESPTSSERGLQRVLALSDIGMATSGDYRNYFSEDGKRYSHIIDPVTGAPIEHNLASVTVLHPSVARADAWATALLVLGAERGLAVAESNGLAVFMLVKEGEEFVERYSSEFQRYL